MLTDFQMVLIFFSVATTICFFTVPIIWDYTNKSKTYTIISIVIVFLLIFSSIHYRDCRKENIKKCLDMHTTGQNYNYCTDSINNNRVDDFCYYGIEKNCGLIPHGCLDESQEHIDGFCISIIPLCFSLNSD